MVMMTNFKDILIREIVPQLKNKLLNTTFPAIAGATGITLLLLQLLMINNDY